MMKPNFVHRGLLSVLFIFLITDVLAKEPVKKTVVQELTERKGLPDFFAKVQQGDTIRVACLGGSITARQGWRVYSLEWMKERFPQSGFIYFT
jgi:hypothetical protein